MPVGHIVSVATEDLALFVPREVFFSESIIVSTED
jgi:hypothetical protein